MNPNRNYDSVVVCVTNHSHDETGDMYSGPTSSADCGDVFELLFPPRLCDALEGRKVLLMMLACGAFVENLAPRTALLKLSRR